MSLGGTRGRCEVTLTLNLGAAQAPASANASWWAEHLGDDAKSGTAARATPVSATPALHSHPVSEPGPRAGGGGRMSDAELQRATAAWNLGGARWPAGSARAANSCTRFWCWRMRRLATGGCRRRCTGRTSMTAYFGGSCCV